MRAERSRNEVAEMVKGEKRRFSSTINCFLNNSFNIYAAFNAVAGVLNLALLAAILVSLAKAS